MFIFTAFSYLSIYVYTVYNIYILCVHILGSLMSISNIFPHTSHINPYFSYLLPQEELGPWDLPKAPDLWRSLWRWAIDNPATSSGQPNSFNHPKYMCPICVPKGKKIYLSSDSVLVVFVFFDEQCVGPSNLSFKMPTNNTLGSRQCATNHHLSNDDPKKDPGQSTMPLHWCEGSWAARFHQWSLGLSALLSRLKSCKMSKGSSFEVWIKAHGAKNV